MADSNNNFGFIDPITNAIGSLYNIGSGIANQIQNAKNDKWNKEMAERQFAYTKEINDRNFKYQQDLNNRIMDREDNAVQRRAADLQAAGISKNLAAGSSAQAQTMSSANANSPGNGAVAETGFNAKQLQLSEFSIANSYQEYLMNRANTTLINQQAINAAKEAGLIDEKTATEKTQQNLNKASTYKANEEAKALKYNRELSEKYGIRINDILDTKYNTLKAMVVDAVKEEGLIYGSVRSFEDIANGILQVEKALHKVNNNIYKKIVNDKSHWLRRYIDFSEKPTREQIDILIERFLKGK